MLRQVRPAVGRLVHAVALGDVRAHVGLAGADVDHARIRRREREGADRADRLPVEDRLPGAAGVGRLPDAAVHAAEVEVQRLGRHAGDGEHAAAAERPDEAPVQVAERVFGSKRRRGGHGERQGEEQAREGGPHGAA